MSTGLLAALRQRPYELLREMERRSKVALASGATRGSENQEWVGIACLLAHERFLIPRTDVREVMIMPAAVTRVPGARDWVAGLANLRGQLLPVVDLRSFLGAGSSRNVRTARVLVLDAPEMQVGIIVDEVFGFRRFLAGEFSSALPQTALRCERFLAGACSRGDDTWPVLSLQRLIAASEFQQAAA